MSPRPTDAPQRVIAAAADMLARVGLNATSIREVTKAADAPLGSTYHHFPGGKQELLARATTQAGDKVDALLAELLQDGAEPGLQQFLQMWRARLLRTQFAAGCPCWRLLWKNRWMRWPARHAVQRRQCSRSGNSAWALRCWRPAMRRRRPPRRPR